MSDGQVTLDSLLAEVDASPDSFEANQAASEQYFSLGELDAGLPYLERALALDPTYAAGHNQMGVYFFQTGRLDEAERSFTNALQNDFLLLDAHFNLATLYQQKGDYARALSFYKEVVEASPGDSEIWARMGECAANLGHGQDAMVLFEETLRLNPADLNAAVRLSNMYLEEGKLEAATDVLLALLLHHADIPPTIHFTLGLLFEGQGQYQAAMTHLRDAVIADEQNEETFYHLGRCARFLDKGEEAVAFLSRAVKIEPGYAGAIFELGQTYYDLGQIENAIVAFRECLRVQAGKREEAAQWGDPMDEAEDVPVYNALGYCHLQLEDYDTARSAWEKSLSLDPDQPDIESAIDDIPRPLYQPVSLTIDD
ncbi:MAG: tetratricopeptide repeat protein [Chloroflexi bacterium]|nr:tetratricopeptide repeat protein [Chloroflexota bacterium]